MPVKPFAHRVHGVNPYLLSIPVADIDQNPLETVRIHIDWVRFIVSRLDSLLNEDVWDGTEAEKTRAVRQIEIFRRDFYV